MTVRVLWLFLTVPRVVGAVCDLVFPGHTHLLFYGVLVYKSKRIVGKPSIRDQFVNYYKRVGYYEDVCYETVCMPAYKPNFVIKSVGRRELVDLNLLSSGCLLTDSVL